jgi:uncharacterized protein (DUF4415 family)
MNSKMVRYTLDLRNPPPLTEEQNARLDALAKRPASEIDLSDIPELTGEFWKNAVRNPYLYKPTKTSTTVRIDSDVLQWLRGLGKGYQSRINAILRREMLTALKSAGSKPTQPASKPRSAAKAIPITKRAVPTRSA